MHGSLGNHAGSTQRYKGTSDLQSDSPQVFSNLTSPHILSLKMSSTHNYRLFGYFDDVHATFRARAFPDQPPPRFEDSAIQSLYARDLKPPADVGNASVASNPSRFERLRFDEAVDLIDHFFHHETGADSWKIHAALNQVQPALVSCVPYFSRLFRAHTLLSKLTLLDFNHQQRQLLLFDDGCAFRRAQLLALSQPPEFFEEAWTVWFLPQRAGRTLFGVDEVVHPDLFDNTPAPLSQLVSS